jgi:nucleoside-diphosphate-sugar epimerase
MKKDKNILITGASGLAGSHIAQYFSKYEKNLFCLVRKGSDISFIKDLPVKIIYGDILDPKGLETIFAGMDWIIHTAAKVTDWGNLDDYIQTNVTGTENVLNAVLRNNIKNVIITGSVSSYGEENSTVLKDETCPFSSHYPYAFDRFLPAGMNHYRDTKAESTRRSMAFAMQHGINLTVIEPVWIFGENESRSGFYEYLQIARSGMPFMPGSKSNTFHVIYAPELARAYYLAFQKELTGTHRIIIGNRTPENMQHIYGLFCMEAGLKQPRLIPKWAIYPVALAMEGIYQLLKCRNHPILMRSRVNMFYDSIGFSTKNAERLIGFTNGVDLETGISNTVQWYKKNNRI